MPSVGAPAPPAVRAPTTVAAPPPPPQIMPTPSVAQPSQPAQPAHREQAASSVAIAGDGDPTDYTRIPGELDRKFEALDTDGALRATIINPGDPWTRTAHKGLLSSPATTTLSAGDQRTEKNRAFDLLDALSKSGALPIDDASLHVVLAATHCFDKTLLETVIQDNVNPIEKVERSLMIVGTTIHNRSALDLLADDQRARFLVTSPQLGDGA
jgi:hypothetical protein